MYSIFIRNYINKKYICLLVLVTLCFTQAFGQETVASANSIQTPSNISLSSPADSIKLKPDSISKPRKKSAIDAVIDYQASDSIVFFSNGKGFLYGKATVDYKEIQLKAEYIEMDMDSSLVYASGVKDSVGDIIGSPVFKEGSETYESRTIKYNFETKKGYIQHVVTQQGEGYVVSERTKKTADDMLYMQDGRYTTCSNHEHPHFYLNLTKAKVKPKSYIATGPAYLVMEDVPLPLAIPFGYFPFTDSYSSGIIMPSYGDELTRGFFLRDGGYYFALSDYIDFALTGDIYTKGSWAVRGASSYVKRYKYHGSFNASYMVTIDGEKDIEGYQKYKDFSFGWTHDQDPKANLYRTLKASVNFTTSSYARNNVSTRNNPEKLSENTKMSSIVLTQRIPNVPLSFNMTTGINQRTQDSTITLMLPDLNISLSRIYPFKRKNAIGKERFYEKISLSYTGYLKNDITTKEDKFSDATWNKDWDKGMSHKVPISASFPLFKYITISPSINFNDYFYFSAVDQSWDIDSQTAVLDTTYGFKNLYDFSASISALTKLYVFFKPLPAIFGEKINMVRWVLTPTINFSTHPDLSYQNWSSYVKTFPNGEQMVIPYNRYYNPKLGLASPEYGKSGSISFTLANNLEMKVKSKNDSTGIKKISLIDNFDVFGAYNLMADSINWSDFMANLRLKFTDKFGISLSGAFDPYEYQLDPNGNPYKVNDLRWNNGKFPQLIGTNTSFSYTFNNDTFKKKKKEEEADQSAETEKTEETEASLLNPKKEKKELTTDGYAKFEMPWSLGFNYSLRYGRSDFNKDEMQYNLAFSHNIGFTGSLSLTQKWHFSFSADYDITNDMINYTSCSISRDLHCWSMTASIVPIGLYTSYTFTVRIKSSLLQDLKYEQRSNSSPSVW